MPLPPAARALPRYLNRVLRPAAAYLPPLAVLHHIGRRSGTPYDTPVQAYRAKDGFLIACAYSENPQWALNLQAAGCGHRHPHPRRNHPHPDQPAHARRRRPATAAWPCRAGHAEPRHRPVHAIRQSLSFQQAGLPPGLPSPCERENAPPPFRGTCSRSRAERVEAMRLRLMEATLWCIADKDYAATSTNDVVRRTG